MAAGDGLVTQRFNPGAQLLLMRRVAHRKTGRNGKRADARRLAQDGSFGRRLIQRRSRMAASVMAAGQGHNGLSTHQLKQPAGLDLGRLIASQQDTDRRALAFDHRVGRQRGGQRHQHHLGQHVLGQPVQRGADANRQVKPGGQALRRCHHLLVLVQQHRVGVGATGVDTQEIPHASALDDIDRQAASAGLLVFGHHVAAGIAHGFDHLVQRHKMGAITAQCHARRIERLD